MARIPRDSRIETREARLRLKRREEPYWRQIHPGLAVGYLRGVTGGVWRVREYCGGPSPYRKGRLGKADDHADGDGRDVLSYKDAVNKAIVWSNQEHDANMPVSDLTVTQVMDDYMEWHKAHSRNWQSTEYILRQHIILKLGARKISGLSENTIERWHLKLAKTDSDDSEIQRKRKATANRVLSVLKAGLNRKKAIRQYKHLWVDVEPFRDVDAPKVRFLSTVECRRLLNASPSDLRQIVRAALLTGCRYGELARLSVTDFNEDAGTVTISHTKSRRTRHVPLTDEGQQFFSDAVLGLEHDDLIFRRSNGDPWNKSAQIRPMKAASEAAKIKPPVSFHVLRHSYGSLLANEGVSLQVIATAMGHADTRMTEKHYAHLRPDHVAREIRKSLPRFEARKRKNVERLR